MEPRLPLRVYEVTTVTKPTRSGGREVQLMSITCLPSPRGRAAHSIAECELIAGFGCPGSRQLRLELQQGSVQRRVAHGRHQLWVDAHGET